MNCQGNSFHERLPFISGLQRNHFKPLAAFHKKRG
jgi:hypothetical protein